MTAPRKTCRATVIERRTWRDATVGRGCRNPATHGDYCWLHAPKKVREPELLGRPRYRVRFRLEDDARLRSMETLAGEPPKLVETKLGRLLVARDQADGSIQLFSWELIVDVVIEQGDRYGDWHQIGTWTPEGEERVR